MIIHANCIQIDDKGVLILGPSGSGKSSLTADFIARGARLVADDRMALERRGDRVFGAAPSSISGLIELRGIGIVEMPYLEETAIDLVVDLGQTEKDRFPKNNRYEVLGISHPLLKSVSGTHFSAAIILALKYGWKNADD
ncbi:MAG: HPr kinase/phosphorylase [Halocynthiibacter sp.]